MQKLYGPVMQMAFVVDDLDAALDHWNNKMGVGPFYLFEHITFGEIFFRGAASQVDMTAAIAYWGDMQIELIKQYDAGPSIYRDFKNQGLRGMQHVGVITPNMDEQLARLAKLDISPVQWGSMPTGMRFAYVDSDTMPGTMVELIEPVPAITDYFNSMKSAAALWDGSNGVIKV